MNRDEEGDPLTVVFQNLHYDYEWDISDGSSLWSIFILNNITEPLIRVGNNSDLTPALASGWSLSENKKTLSLDISDQYLFHDGSPITPEDVFVSLKRSFSSGSMKHSEIHKFLAGGSLDKSILLRGRKIEIRLETPLNALAYKLSIPEMGVAPQGYASGKTHKESLGNLSGPLPSNKVYGKQNGIKKAFGAPIGSSKVS